MTFLSLKRTLINSASKALFSKHEGESIRFTCFSQSESIHGLDWAEIPLRKKATGQEILYTSAIGHLIFARKNEDQSLTLSAITEAIITQLKDSQSKTINSKTINNNKNTRSCELDHKKTSNSMVFQLWDEFEIETQRSGWVAFRLSKAGLDTWLNTLSSQLTSMANHILELPVPPSDYISPEALSSDPQVWQIQYVYARCCCLLRLWNAKLDKRYQVTNDTRLVLESTDSRETSREPSREHSEARVAHNPDSAKRSVIHNLTALLDLAESDLFWIPYRYPSKQYFLLLKATNQLCQSFELFTAVDLSGFGQVNDFSPASVKRHFQTLFTLTLIVQKTLEVLMYRCLGIRAAAVL